LTPAPEQKELTMRHLKRVLAVVGLAVTTSGLVVGTAVADPPPRTYTPLPPKIDVNEPTSPFKEVKTLTDGTSAYIQFAYPGGPLPVVTLGSSSNVKANMLAAFPATYHSNIGKWDVRFDYLVPGTKYWFQIDSGAQPHIGVVQTMYRDVFVDFYRVDVIDDGDDGGCGDFWISYEHDGDSRSTGEHCIDTGMYWGKYAPPGGTASGGFGEWHLNDYRESKVDFSFWMLDNDTIGEIGDCGGPKFASCGDLAYGFRNWDVPTAAGTTEKVFSVTQDNGGVDATAHARITVSYRR
jgi:hypothetical protein